MSISQGSIALRSLLEVLSSSQKWRLATAILLLVLGGLAEGIGIVSLLPILANVESTSATEAATLPQGLRQIFDVLSLRPSLGTLLLLLVLALVVKGVLFLFATYDSAKVGAEIARDLRLSLTHALSESRWEFFADRQPGALANSISSEAGRATDFFSNLALMSSHALQGLVYVSIALLISPAVSIAAMLMGIVMLYSLSFVVNAARRASVRHAALLSSLTARLADTVSAMKPLRAMGREDAARPHLEEDVEAVNVEERKQALMRSIPPIIQEPYVAAGLAVGIYVALQLTTASLARLLFLGLVFQRIVTRFTTAQSHFQSAQVMLGPLDRIFAVIRDARNAKEMSQGVRTAPGLSQGILLESVSFSYGSRRVLDELSVEFTAGSITAITGRSGVGKTTLIDLLCGLLEPTEGRILVDGVDLKTIEMKAWRAGIGYLPQEMTLLYGSIEENITLGDPSITDLDVYEALDRAGALEFVESLPQGLETQVGERGSSFSGGQRQRLAIARALARKPRLLILDEATSALDPSMERSLSERISSLRGRSTVIAITHRGPLTDLADAVVNLDHEVL